MLGQGESPNSRRFQGEFIDGMGGDFLLPRDAATPLALIACGIGMTPFASQLERDALAGITRDVVVMCSASESRELAYAELQVQRVSTDHLSEY